MPSPIYLVGTTLVVVMPFEMPSLHGIIDDTRDSRKARKREVLRIIGLIGPAYHMAVLKPWGEKPELSKVIEFGIIEMRCHFSYFGKGPYRPADYNPSLQEKLREMKGGFDWNPKNVHLHEDSGLLESPEVLERWWGAGV